VCTHLKADPVTRDIPVIFVTAHRDEASETQGLDLGAVDFIYKPINTKIVRARVKTHITLKQQTDLLRRWVYIDGLTGVYNRRYFDEVLSTEWQRSIRNDTELSLILIDVDYFKRYNDNYSHQAGDDCLKRVAEAIRLCIKRPADLLARYGGEEFVCLLPETNREGANLFAEEVRKAVIELQIEHLASTVMPIVTLSLGVSSKLAGYKGTTADLLEKADEQLYRAKAEGRNRTCSAPL
jgi:diguanylate cyclase (GGDEF)-like protein